MQYTLSRGGGGIVKRKRQLDAALWGLRNRMLNEPFRANRWRADNFSGC